MRFEVVEGEISEDFLLAIKKGDNKKIFTFLKLFWIRLRVFFLLLFSNSLMAFHLNSISHIAQKALVLCLRSSCSMTQNNIIDESFFLFRGWKNIYQFSVSHKFSISTVTLLFVSRRCRLELMGEQSVGHLNFACFSHDFRRFSYFAAERMNKANIGESKQTRKKNTDKPKQKQHETVFNSEKIV